MTTTAPTDHRIADLVAALRVATGRPGSDAAVAARVAATLAEQPGLPLLGELRGTPERVAGHLLHAERDLSVLALVWLPGQVTSIHDHLCWCVVHVAHRTVRETRFRVEGAGLTTTGSRPRAAGATSVLVPPDDIHRIGNDTLDTAVTLHVYGMDLRTGSSTRRRYLDVARGVA
ncbi:cysteine dioxygenase family protein [Actinomycetes bacterium KLBMP 9759]